MDNSTGLTPDLTQLAAALERVEFEEGEVLDSIRQAQADGASQIGYFPQQGEARFLVYPVLSFKEDHAALVVVAFDGNLKPTDPNVVPEFTSALHTTAGDMLLSSTDQEGHQVIPLSDPGLLIGARLELVT